MVGSITDDRILPALPDDLDYAFHLACYHGNQSSIADPIADHDNNTLTTLKLFERLEGHQDPEEGRLLGGRLRGGREDLRRRHRDHRRRAGLPLPRQPLFDLQAGRRNVRQLLFQPPRHAVREGAVPERLRPRRDPGRRPLARHAGNGVAQRHADLHLEGAARRGAAGRERRHRSAATSSSSRTWRAA